MKEKSPKSFSIGKSFAVVVVVVWMDRKREKCHDHNEPVKENKQNISAIKWSNQAVYTHEEELEKYRKYLFRVSCVLSNLLQVYYERIGEGNLWKTREKDDQTKNCCLISKIRRGGRKEKEKVREITTIWRILHKLF